MSHEAFYTSGTWTDESLGVYVGWTSRSGSPFSSMPVCSETGGVTLVFSGEDFPDPGVARRLKQTGQESSKGRPSYLVRWYEEDPSFPKGLNGRFHGLVVDSRRGRVLLFNDRYGIHRLQYHDDGDAFYFSAEAKAIVAVQPRLKRLSAKSLGEFIACGSALENRTLFEGIEVMPPASAWEFENGALVKRGRYFDPREWEEQEPLDIESYHRAFQEAFILNLPKYFSGHEQVAMSLTGGLDTRMIMACAKAAPKSLPCYTFGSSLRDIQDVVVARAVASVCGQSHQTIRVGEEFLSRAPHYAVRAVYVGEGGADVGRAPDIYLNERARAIAPVRITGNFGGEVLRGVRAFKPEERTETLFCDDLHQHIRQTEQTYAALLHGHPTSFAVFKQGPWYNYGIVALEESQLSLRSPFLDNDIVRTVFRAPASALASNEASLRLIASGNEALSQIPTDRGLGGRQGRVREFASRVRLELLFKAEYAYDMGMPHWLAALDHSLSALRIERLFLGRHKPFHFRVWYRDSLAQFVREVLLDPRSLSRPYLNKKRVEELVEGHLAGRRNYTNEIHKVLTLELMNRLFLDDPECVHSSVGA
ncbi:MAG: hypothetical protein IH602_06555 [Bryobacteraceae bacterium]|nr:hypothetical protein [Bryobacteraceae bacterium]